MSTYSSEERAVEEGEAELKLSKGSSSSVSEYGTVTGKSRPEGDAMSGGSSVTNAKTWLSSGKTLHKKYGWMFWYLLLTVYTCYAVYYCVTNDVEHGSYFGWILIYILFLSHRLVEVFRTTLHLHVRPKFSACLGWFDSESKSKWFKIAEGGLYAVTVMLMGFVCNIAVVQKEAREPTRLAAILGIGCIIAVCISLSGDPKSIRWQGFLGPVWIHFILVLLVVQTSAGRSVVEWASDIVTTFLGFVGAGQAFILGEDILPINGSWVPVDTNNGVTDQPILHHLVVMATVGDDTTAGDVSFHSVPAYMLHYFWAMVCPTTIYFNGVVQLCYHVGILQPVVHGIGSLFHYASGYSTGVGLNAAASIFLGISEAPQMIRAFLPDMSDAELFAVCTVCLATISGSTLGGYMSMNIPAPNLIVCVASSGCIALALSALVYPTKKVHANIKVKDYIGGSKYSSAIDAICAGIIQTIMLSINIYVMVSAFTSYMALCSCVLNWLCSMVGVTGPDGTDVTIELVLGYILMPIMWLIGCPWSDANSMGAVMAIKIVANEFIAFGMLGKYYDAYHSCGLIGSDTYFSNEVFCSKPEVATLLVNSETSLTVTSFALCGFANLASVGIAIACFTQMLPEERHAAVAKIAVRAMIVATLANCYGAALVSLLQSPDQMWMS